VHGLRGPASVDQAHARAFFGRDFEESFPDLPEERQIFLLQAVAAALPAFLPLGCSGPLQPDGGFDVEHHGEIGNDAAGSDVVDAADDVDPQSPRVPLVGQGCIHIPFGEDQLSLPEARLHHLGDELGAGRGEQQHLRLGRHLRMGVIQEQRADPLPDRRAAGLARVDDLVATAQPLREQLRLRRLPRALRPLDGDEQPPPGHQRGKMTTRRKGSSPRLSEARP
jgi:hypothetical protein